MIVTVVLNLPLWLYNGANFGHLSNCKTIRTQIYWVEISLKKYVQKMRMATCKYCNREFAKASNLYKHLRSTKYCLQLQEEQAERNSQLTCEYCKKVLSRADSLNRHLYTCIDYQVHLRTVALETEIKHLRERLAEKDTQLHEKEEQVRELTTLAINKPSMHITQLGHEPVSYSVNQIGQQPMYKHAETLTRMINDLYGQVMIMFPGYQPPTRLLTDK